MLKVEGDICRSTILTECIVATEVTLHHGRVYTFNKSYAKAPQLHVVRTLHFLFNPAVKSLN